MGIDFDGPDQVLVGVPFEISVNISNDSSSVLRDARLNLSLPEGMGFVGKSEDKNVEFKDIGNLGEGSLAQEKFQFMVLSGENTVEYDGRSAWGDILANGVYLYKIIQDNKVVGSGKISIIK